MFVDRADQLGVVAYAGVADGNHAAAKQTGPANPDGGEDIGRRQALTPSNIQVVHPTRR
jgi:hypothetical protein